MTNNITSNVQESHRRETLLPNLILRVGLIIALSLLYFYWLMRPPVAELGLMTLLLSTTAGISAVAGYITYRLGWLEYSPALIWSLLLGNILSGVLTFFNVWLTAQLMFADQHDLLLATVLLVFATGIAIAIGYFFSSALIERILRLRHAAHSIAQGDFNARASVQGRDELADLARVFNDMAVKLQFAQQKQQEVETLRRDLIAWISHDLQTPLTAIRAMVEALSDDVVEDKQTRNRYLMTIQREVSELSALIDDLFQMAQLDAGGLNLDINTASLSDLVSDTLESFTEIAHQRDIHLKGVIDSDVDPVRMDARRIGRVLSNLINNALRHTPPGGVIEISASRQTNQVNIIVSDTGQGIDKDDLPFVFDRFYRGEKSRSRLTGGAGLGLAIARGIVRAHGGDINVLSSPGEGAQFQFSLPIP